MDGLLSQLGIDISVAYQFLVFLFSYLILSNVLFKKVLLVLKTRDDKTTKLEENANEAFQKAEGLAEDYRVKIDEAYSEAQVLFNKEKNEALAEQKASVGTEEQKLAKMIQEETSVFVAQMKESKNKVLSQSEELAGNLVEKLVR